MSTRNSRVFLGFGLAVAAATAAGAGPLFPGTPAPPPAAGGARRAPPPRPGAPPPAGAPLPPRPPRPPRDAEGGAARGAPRRSTAVLEVAGIVFDAAGAPVEGASVAVFHHLDEEADLAPPTGAGAKGPLEPALLEDLFALDPEEAARAVTYTGIPALPGGPGSRDAVGRALTGVDGRFRVRVTNLNVFRVIAEKEGAGRAASGDAKPDGKDVVLRLGPGAALEGRVVNLAGMAPVEGATVVIRSGSVESGAVTGPGGRFAFDDLPPGQYSVAAGAPGLALATISGVEVPSTTGPLEVGLGGGHAIRVLVMEWTAPPPGWRRTAGSALPPGAPIEGARVVVYRAISDNYVTALTGPDGTARFEGLGDGFWRIGAVKDGYGVGGGGRDVRLSAGSPPEETREVRLEVALPTPVRVMDEGGSPVAGARVYFGGRDEEFDEVRSRLVGRTDAEGAIQVVFDGNIPAKSVVWIVPEDGGAVVMVEPEEFGPGTEAKAVVRPGRVIQGTVADGAGKGIKGAELYLMVTDDEAEVDIALYAYSDAEGRYRFPAVPFGEGTLDVDWGEDWESIDFEADDRRAAIVQDFTLGE